MNCYKQVTSITQLGKYSLAISFFIYFASGQALRSSGELCSTDPA